MKEGKDRRRAVFCTVVVGGVLISAAAITLYAPWLGFFGLRQISVSGNHHISAEAIGRAAGLQYGRPLLTISLPEVAARIASFPWVKHVSVSRSFPHELRIRVEERSPIAWIRLPEDETCLTVGEGGVIVASECMSRASTVELQGAALSGVTPGERLADERIVDLIEALRTANLSDMNIQRIDATDPSSIVLDTEPGLRVLLGTIDSHARRVDALAALSRTIDLGEYRVIDLRLEGEATLVTW